MESIPSKEKERSNVIKILIADDDPPTRILLRAAVSQWGYEAIEASDGEDAWTVIKENLPQIAILDWLMPKLDGIGLCERIKQSDIRNPYIILLTQISGTPNIIKGLEAGADEFLSKPFNMAELRSRLAVGAKIIHHQEKFLDYILKIDGAIDKILLTSREISALLNTQQKPIENQDLKKLSELNNQLTDEIELIKKFNLAQK